MKTKLHIFLILICFVIPNFIYSQFTQQGPKLVGTGAVGNSYQGWSVAISSDGNTAIVGGNDDNGLAGAVWIFTRSGGVWTQQGPKLVGTGAIGSDIYLGGSVAISSDGNTAIVGGRGDNSNTGAVWVFTRSGGVWTQQGSKLVGTGAAGGNVYLGWSVAVSSDGNTAVAGGFGDNVAVGAIWIFTRSGGVWTQQGPKLVGTGAAGTAQQGISVAISSDGNTIIEGGRNDNGFTGAIWVFTRSGGVWTQQGPKLVGTGVVQYSNQGISVAISSDGNTAIEGGYQDNYDDGAVWIFTRSGGVWTQQGPKLVGTGATLGAWQGTSVAISSDGNTAIESGPLDNYDVGAVWIFVRRGGVWIQQGQKFIGTGPAGNARQGYSVAISSDSYTFIEGGYYDNGNTGAAWVFVRSNYRLSSSHNNLNKGIQGNQSTLDTITVVTDDVSSYYVSNVKVTIDNITYPNDGDLEISLIHATNTDTLVYQAGGSGANFIGTVLSDSAATPISNGTPPFTGNFKPAKPLSQFFNVDPTGIWILKVYDRNTGHTGTLNAWTLTIDLAPNPISVRNISGVVPKSFSLKQNYPNPFNPSTKIKFDISKSSFTVIKIYDILGREVSTLVNEQLKPGTYEIDFDGSNLPSGVYFYKLTTDGFIETKKMVIIK